MTKKRKPPGWPWQARAIDLIRALAARKWARVPEVATPSINAGSKSRASAELLDEPPLWSGAAARAASAAPRIEPKS